MKKINSPSKVHCESLERIVEQRRVFLEKEYLNKNECGIRYHSSISYQSDCKATVRFHWGTHDVLAIYDINLHQREPSWHCSHDWND